MAVRTLTPTMQSNFRHLYADVFWYGILAGSTLAFLSVYAARLGASSLQISFLTSGPALVNLFFSLPAGRWLEDRSPIRASFWTSILYRSGYLIFIFMPFMLAAVRETWGLVLITLLMSIPGTLLAIAFNAAFADVVPPDWRAEVVGKRNALLAITTTAASLTSGLMLDRLSFPGNYQVVFLIGAIGAGFSSYHLGRLESIDSQPARAGRLLRDLARPGLMRFADAFRIPVGLRFLTRSKHKPLLRTELLHGPFGSFMGAYLLFYIFQFIPIPLFSLYFVHDLKLTDGQISLGSALFYAAMMLASIGLNRITNRIGHRGSMVLGGLFYGIYPLLIGIAQGPQLFWAASLIGGAVWAFLNAGMINRLMERVPSDDRPAYMALHNLVLNTGILIGSLTGPLLVDSIGLREAILAGAGLRLLGGLLLLIWG